MFSVASATDIFNAMCMTPDVATFLASPVFPTTSALEAATISAVDPAVVRGEGSKKRSDDRRGREVGGEVGGGAERIGGGSACC